ncbi:MAG: putative lipid II flippase FtsW [Candidatus Tyrphobacter sp.]
MSGERKAPDFILLGAVAALCLIGLTMILSASSATAASYSTMAYFWQQQCMWLGVGVVLAFVVYHLPPKALRAAAPFAMLAAIIALVLVFIPHIGVPVNGAHRWIHVGRFSFEPSEFAKLALVLYLAAWLGHASARRLGLFALLGGTIPPVIAALLVVCEPDLGTACIIGAVIVAVLFVAGVRLWQLGALSLAALAALAAAVLRHGTWLARFSIFLDPWRDPKNAGFHIIQSLYALGSGGLTGVGLGRSSEKFYYLPEQYTDFIFSVLGEELGMIGTVVVVVLFLVIAFRAYRIASKSPDRFARVLVTGCGAMIVVQAFVNVGVVTSSLPVTGVPLPFISFGGSALIADLVAVALILNIGSRRAVRAAVERRRRFRVIEGKGAGKAAAPQPAEQPPRIAIVPPASPPLLFEPASRRFEALWEIERAVLDASYAFETSVHAP